MVFSPRWRRREPGMSYSRWANSRTICCNSPRARRSRLTRGPSTDRRNKALGSIAFMGTHLVDRSEEHTSELQSLMRISYAVFCLKKKNNITYHLIDYSTKTTVTYTRFQTEIKITHTSHYHIP